MIMHLKWQPSEIKKATLFDLKIAIEAYNDFYGNNTLTEDTVSRLKKMKYGIKN